VSGRKPHLERKHPFRVSDPPPPTWVAVRRRVACGGEFGVYLVWTTRGRGVHRDEVCLHHEREAWAEAGRCDSSWGNWAFMRCERMTHTQQTPHLIGGGTAATGFAWTDQENLDACRRRGERDTVSVWQTMV
jgi:hypothetical protein